MALVRLDDLFLESFDVTDGMYLFIVFLGHLSHSGDLLLWVGVRLRAMCVVHRP